MRHVRNWQRQVRNFQYGIERTNRVHRDALPKGAILPISSGAASSEPRAAQVETESCRISHHVHRIEFREIVRDAEIAYAISPVVRRHCLTEEETEKFLVELRIPRAANVARITHRFGR
jgi:hypothetical protein